MTEFIHPTQATEVKGMSAFNQPPQLMVRGVALLIDCAWILALFCFVIRLFDLSPLPNIKIAPLLVLVVALLWFIQQTFFGATLGQLIWRLKVLTKNKKKRVFQHERLTAPVLMTAIFLTATTLGGAIWCIREAVWKHPLFAQAESWELGPLTPSELEGRSRSSWAVMPLFYTIGPWPRVFDGHPVLYQFPYQKGPPKRFVGNIIARWQPPNIKLTIEGPRTVAQISDIDRIKNCLIKSWQSSLDCIGRRDAALMRHIQEMRSLVAPNAWQLKWFHVKNINFRPEEEPQGIYLSANSAVGAQDRFILINSRGAHQSFILDRPLDGNGELALETLKDAIRAQRIETNLQTSRGWIDSRLATMNLKGLEGMQSASGFVERLADIQALLLSKISVDPETFDTYFHLGGTALLLAREAMKNQSTELTASARPMILSAMKYAEDIAPKDPRTAQLKKIWQAMRKY